MIRFVDNEILENEYFSACDFDNVYGTINSFMYRIHSQNRTGFFWNIYDCEESLCGNLCFVNDTFNLCIKAEKDVEELAQFIDFWGNFKFLNYNNCNVKNLDKLVLTPINTAFGEILNGTEYQNPISFTGEICKDINLYDVFCLFKESFPGKMKNLDFSDFNYDMNCRIRKQQSFIFGIKKDGVLASAIEIMCLSPKSTIIGCLATSKEYRSMGYASSLLQFVSKEFSRSTLYVFADNDKVAQFYKKIGFEKSAAWAQLTVRKD